MKEFQYKIIAPISPLQSPDISAPIGNSCGPPKKGDTPFFSKKGYNFLDVGNDGSRQSKNPNLGIIKEIKQQFLAKKPIWNNNAKNQDRSGNGAKNNLKYEVTIKNGAISAIRLVTKSDGSKITSRFGGRYIPKDKLRDYSIKILGLGDKPDGIYEV